MNETDLSHCELRIKSRQCQIATAHSVLNCLNVRFEIKGWVKGREGLKEGEEKGRKDPEGMMSSKKGKNETRMQGRKEG